MARPSQIWTNTVYVENRLFVMTGFHEASGPSVRTGELVAAWYVPSGGPDSGGTHDRLLVESAASSHDAGVEIQLWEEPPGLDASTWDAITDLEADCPDGRIKVGVLTGSPDDFELLLDPGRYGIRVHVRGRDEVRQAVEAWEDALLETDEELDNPQNLEQYLIQLWRIHPSN